MERLVRARGRRALNAFPLALLGLLLLQIVLLPAHGLPGHEVSTAGGGAAEKSIAAPAVLDTEAGHVGAGHVGAGHVHEGHGHEGGGPVCHAGPHYADMVVNRFVSSDFGKLMPGVLFAVAVLLAVPSLLPRPPSHRRWSSRPHWRPSGADLLTRVCIARA